MGIVHNLEAITQAVEALCKSLKDGYWGKDVNARLFNDVNLSLSQAMVIAWLMNHKDATYSTWQMASELLMEESRVNEIIGDLFEYGFLEKHGEDVDIINHVYFRILNFQDKRECESVKDWRDYVARGFDSYDWEEEDKDEYTLHIIDDSDYMISIDQEDEDALESMEDFDLLEGLCYDEEDESEDTDDDYD